MRASEVILVLEIKTEHRVAFHDVRGNREENIMKISYALQELENMPTVCDVPARGDG